MEGERRRSAIAGLLATGGGKSVTLSATVQAIEKRRSCPDFYLIMGEKGEKEKKAQNFYDFSRKEKEVPHKSKQPISCAGRATRRREGAHLLCPNRGKKRKGGEREAPLLPRETRLVPNRSALLREEEKKGKNTLCLAASPQREKEKKNYSNPGNACRVITQRRERGGKKENNNNGD